MWKFSQTHIDALWRVVWEIEHGFLDGYFPLVLLIRSSSSLFFFISEWTVIRTVRTTWPRSNGKYVQLLLSGMPQEKMGVRKNGAGGHCNVPQMRVPCSPAALISGTLKAEGDASYLPKLSHTVYPPGLTSHPSLPMHYWAISFNPLCQVWDFLRARHCCDKLKLLSVIWH